MIKTKILYLISSLSQGGAERHLVELAGRLDPDRYEASICVLREDDVHFERDLPAGEPRYCLGARTWLAPRAFARLLSALRAARPAVLHTYLNDANLWGRVATLAGARPRVITSVHCGEMPAGYRFVERLLAGRSDRIVAHSRGIAHLLTEELGVAAARVALIPNGVDPARFRPSVSGVAAAARAAQGLAPDDFVALMPSRLSPLKNHDVVIEALGALRARGELPARFRLLLAGRVSSRPFARKVRALAAAAGLAGQVRFLGAVRDMPALYAAADVVLMPSRTEASPIAALEALACGVPVLISAAANTDGVVAAGLHGWQIDRPDVASVAGGLRAVLDCPAAERSRMAELARAHVIERFTAARMAADFMRLYDALVPQAR